MYGGDSKVYDKNNDDRTLTSLFASENDAQFVEFFVEYSIDE